MTLESIGARWSNRISQSFIDWANQEKKSRTIEIRPFDPRPLINKAYYAGGAYRLEEIGKVVGMGVKFNLKTPEAIAWNLKYGAQEVKYINAATQQTIRQVTAAGLNEGLNLAERTKEIKKVVGLLPQHAVAVRNYYERSIAAGMDEALADKMASKYANKLLTYRANMIGNSESMTSMNEASRISDQSAVDRGIIDPKEIYQEWLTSRLGNVCDECKEMQGKQAPIGGTFPNGSRGPPLHPHDKCVTILQTRK